MACRDNCEKSSALEFVIHFYETEKNIELFKFLYQNRNGTYQFINQPNINYQPFLL